MADKGKYVLVPLGTVSSERIPVPDGETILGRGPFLKITDKRVSRSHATLSSEGGRLLLRLKHATNPCFYKAAGSTTYIQMQKDAEQSLSEGDCFSFLPNSLQFELQCVPKETDVKGKRTTEAEHEQDADEKEDNAMDSSRLVKNPPDSSSCVAEPGPSEKGFNPHQAEVESHGPDMDACQPVIDTSEVDGDSYQKHADTSVMAEREEKDISTQNDSAVGCLGKKRRLPVWLSSSGVKEEEEEESKGKKKTAKGKTPATASKLPAKKRARIGSDDAVKESPPAKKRVQRKASQSTSPEAPPAPEDGSGNKNEEEISERVPHTTKSPPRGKSHLPSDKSPPPTDKSLPPCPYGRSCYRKNPAHFKEYSHLQGDGVKEVEDSDGSGDGDDRPECPYGTACYRRNALHRQQYRHSAAPAASPPRTTRTRRKKTVTSKGCSSVHDDESDDDGLPNTYDYNDSFIDDDGTNSGSLSGDDDSDEDWQHPGGDDGGGGGEDSEEDVKELVKEAHEFVSNPKLRRR